MSEFYYTTNGICSRCDKPYTYNNGHWPEDSVENPLWIAFMGGYACFTDTTIELIMEGKSIPVEPKAQITDEGTCLTCAFKRLDVTLCHECAHELCDWLGIPREEVAKWHAHSMFYMESHPDHFGWDYDHNKNWLEGADDGV